MRRETAGLGGGLSLTPLGRKGSEKGKDLLFLLYLVFCYRKCLKLFSSVLFSFFFFSGSCGKIKGWGGTDWAFYLHRTNVFQWFWSETLSCHQDPVEDTEEPRHGGVYMIAG